MNSWQTMCKDESVPVGNVICLAASPSNTFRCQPLCVTVCTPWFFAGAKKTEKAGNKP